MFLNVFMCRGGTNICQNSIFLAAFLLKNFGQLYLKFDNYVLTYVENFINGIFKRLTASIKFSTMPFPLQFQMCLAHRYHGELPTQNVTSHLCGRAKVTY